MTSADIAGWVLLLWFLSMATVLIVYAIRSGRDD